jgi:hypothetical protein
MRGPLKLLAGLLFDAFFSTYHRNVVHVDDMIEEHVDVLGKLCTT